MRVIFLVLLISSVSASEPPSPAQNCRKTLTKLSIPFPDVKIAVAPKGGLILPYGSKAFAYWRNQQLGYAPDTSFANQFLTENEAVTSFETQFYFQGKDLMSDRLPGILDEEGFKALLIKNAEAVSWTSTSETFTYVYFKTLLGEPFILFKEGHISHSILALTGERFFPGATGTWGGTIALSYELDKEKAIHVKGITMDNGGWIKDGQKDLRQTLKEMLLTIESKFNLSPSTRMSVSGRWENELISSEFLLKNFLISLRPSLDNDAGDKTQFTSSLSPLLNHDLIFPKGEFAGLNLARDYFRNFNYNDLLKGLAEFGASASQKFKWILFDHHGSPIFVVWPSEGFGHDVIDDAMRDLNINLKYIIGADATLTHSSTRSSLKIFVDKPLLYSKIEIQFPFLPAENTATWIADKLRTEIIGGIAINLPIDIKID